MPVKVGQEICINTAHHVMEIINYVPPAEPAVQYCKVSRLHTAVTKILVLYKQKAFSAFPSHKDCHCATTAFLTSSEEAVLLNTEFYVPGNTSTHLLAKTSFHGVTVRRISAVEKQDRSSKRTNRKGMLTHL